jgi:hypothetical protein
MFRAIPDREVAAFREFIYTTPPDQLPSPRNPTCAFDVMPSELSIGDKALRRIVKRAYDMGREAARNEDEHGEKLREYLDGAPHHREIAQSLKSVGLTDAQVLTVCNVLSEADAKAMDDPPDFPGKPLTGGGQVPLRETHGMDARNLAMDAVRRVKIDPPYFTRVPTTFAFDEVAMADFERRFGLPPLKFA